jgi:hypothetical protein
MINHDYAKLSREALLEQFELERQAWLAAGMSEEDIRRIHFGTEEDKGMGGDYGVWLSERKHIRGDHKYCPGVPLSIEGSDPDGVWIRDPRNNLADAEANADFSHALGTLTELQRFSFIEVCINGRTYRDVAAEIEKHYTTIEQAVKGARKKLKNIF